MLAARRGLAVVVLARVSWRGDRQSSNEAEREGTPVGAQRCGRDGARGARRHDRRASTRSVARSRNDVLAARRALDVASVGLVNPSRRCDGADGRGDVTRHTTAATAARRAHESTKGSVRARQGRRRSVSRTPRSRPGARSTSPASALEEPSRRCHEESDEGWARLWAQASGPDDCVVLGCIRVRRICLQGYLVSAGLTDDRNDGSPAVRRLLGVGASDQLAAAMSGEAAEAARGDGSRHAATQAARRTRLTATWSSHVRRGRRRSVGKATCSRLGARSASPVSALGEPSR